MDKPARQRIEKPYYMKGLSKPEPLVRVDPEAEPEPEDETPTMVFWCVRHAVYETEECDDG
jgi:hypothetical protein